MDEPFFDTNVLLYLLSADSRKAARSRELLAGAGVISVQVLNEFASVAMRKHALDWGELEAILSGFRARLRVESLTAATQARAMEFARHHRLGVYDAMILAAAEQAGCEVVYTEDLNHGQRIAGMLIRNPFA